MRFSSPVVLLFSRTRLRLARCGLAAGLAALALGSAHDAAACGGCFVGEMENTQVTGHKMIFSISTTETTLWDQISYSGDPASFSWVLPIKGMVTVGLSSDALFEELEAVTSVTVSPPPLNCPVPSCYQAKGGFGADASASGAGGAGGVNVIAQQVVGPYDTVQLSSSDPGALEAWLAMNGYVIPPDVAPVITAYVSEGFDFLALKLVPGMGVSSIKPVRVSTPGAGATLPLRMVAAGTGTKTPITLWIFGEGRYQPSNFPWFLITGKELVWDFAQSSSNYDTLKQSGFDATSGRGWLVETSTPFSSWQISDDLSSLAMYDPTDSGYADDMGNGAVAALDADLAKLYGDIDPSSLWLTRTTSELTRAALANDLDLGASADQSIVSGFLTAEQAVNTPPCPSYPPCAGGAGGSGGGESGSNGRGSSGGCAVPNDSGSSGELAAVALALGVALARRRRGR
jgi:MYXO-CTERM domain-containing protein